MYLNLVAEICLSSYNSSGGDDGENGFCSEMKKAKGHQCRWNQEDLEFPILLGCQNIAVKQVWGRSQEKWRVVQKHYNAVKKEQGGKICFPIASRLEQTKHVLSDSQIIPIDLN